MSAMQYRQIVGTSLPVARLVMGTMIVNIQERERSFELLDAVFALGGNAFDTAHVYAGGNSERCLGAWLQARGNRDKVFILSKGCHPNQDRVRVSPFDLAADLYDTLARLQTDYLDAYVLHRDDPSVPVSLIMDALNEHHAAGRIRLFGGSNWTHQRIAEANAYAASHGLVPMTISSPNYGLAEQVLDPWGPGCVSISGPSNVDARAWYTASQMPVFAYSSLGRGLFSGRFSRENMADSVKLLDNAARKAYLHEVNLRRLDRVQLLAAQRGCSVPQVALAYVLHSPLNVFPIVGAANGAEFAEDMRALDIVLTPEECAWLDLERDDPVAPSEALTQPERQPKT